MWNSSRKEGLQKDFEPSLRAARHGQIKTKRLILENHCKLVFIRSFLHYVTFCESYRYCDSKTVIINFSLVVFYLLKNKDLIDTKINHNNFFPADGLTGK